jgi:hypothetical protein
LGLIAKTITLVIVEIRYTRRGLGDITLAIASVVIDSILRAVVVGAVLPIMGTVLPVLRTVLPILRAVLPIIGIVLPLVVLSRCCSHRTSEKKNTQYFFHNSSF